MKLTVGSVENVMERGSTPVQHHGFSAIENSKEKQTEHKGYQMRVDSAALGQGSPPQLLTLHPMKKPLDGAEDINNINSIHPKEGANQNQLSAADSERSCPAPRGRLGKRRRCNS